MALTRLLELLLAVAVLWVLADGHPMSSRHSGTNDAQVPARDGGGVIEGQEFLQLYINSQQQQPIQPNQATQSVSVSVDLSDVSDDDDDDDDEEEHLPQRADRNIVKLVTTGSRIVFLDDGVPAEAVSSTRNASDTVRVTSTNVSSSELASSTPENPAADDLAEDSMNEASSQFETILQPPPSTTPAYRDHPEMGGARPRSVSYASSNQAVAADPVASTRNRSTYRPAKAAADTAHISEPAKVYSEPAKVYSEPAKNYAEPERIYSEPSKVYSEPAKVYSEPAKVYSEPAKVYSEPAQNYGEPAKVYSEPARVYSLPAGSEGAPTSSGDQSAKAANSPLIQSPASTSFHFGVHNVPPAKRIIFNLDKLPYDLLNAPVGDEMRSNKNYLFAPQLDGQRFHQFTRKESGQQFGALPSLPDGSAPQPAVDDDPAAEEEAAEAATFRPEEASEESTAAAAEPHDDSPAPKVGFVVEGRNYRKYRVEEKTPDGFIVGEYGVVSNNDGSLRGVRYTADSTISPNLIYETLMKFLSL